MNRLSNESANHIEIKIIQFMDIILSLLFKSFILSFIALSLYLLLS
ncbi:MULTISPECIES: hypothetical protein [Heyndrickxia]|nr:hypothetical protein [Heyndrickxia oleronia]NYV65398.1 hypothetical protein [Bacillus sp. Gen3]MBU5210047.1 hypothetical protein [Heyndrickxia oleronia]MCI1592312.1 hypothetical protein [Heyndrickxia oleronia]MCI1615243.1 hypothetical protein [Heyndrickxia oleronia]MCI1763295.1 hypothetical protein [Heyndrickxia oleronia]